MEMEARRFEEILEEMGCGSGKGHERRQDVDRERGSETGTKSKMVHHGYRGLRE